MATGPVSSAHSQSAPTPPQTLRSGSQVTTTPEALRGGQGKTYYHLAHGARFVMPDGLEVIFLGGQFTTIDKEIIAELDKVANRPTSMIYTKQAALLAAAATVTGAAASDAAGGDVGTATA